MVEGLEQWDWALALVLGACVAWLICRLRMQSRNWVERAEHERIQTDREEAKSALARESQRSHDLEESLQRAEAQIEQTRQDNTTLERDLAATRERGLSLARQLAEQKTEMLALQKKLTAEFENLANRILDENSKKFVVRNQESIDKLLAPLGEKLTSFRERVEKTHEQGIRDREALFAQLKQLAELNQRMGQEANDLTRALKGESKTQGTWGELILETVLEKSGLVKGQEYETQANAVAEEGRRLQPDVLIKLPEGRRLVVDAKVSLVAYERTVNARDDADREAAAKDHLVSLRSHISDLGKKRYDQLYAIRSPDFVLMFVPVEPAFTLAMQRDEGLFDAAFRQSVVLVTPTTLLATLRTVANIWRQEKQSRNVMEIARRSGALYDKFVGFYGNLEEIGRWIGKSQEAYEEAVKKLQTGRGNLVRSVEDIKRLGAQAKKELPEEATEAALRGD